MIYFEHVKITLQLNNFPVTFNVNLLLGLGRAKHEGVR